MDSVPSSTIYWAVIDDAWSPPSYPGEAEVVEEDLMGVARRGKCLKEAFVTRMNMR